jgi:hypothetical protein
MIRGTIVKFDPATGNVTAPVAATDCNGILVDDTNATTTAMPCEVYVSGKFKADRITWPGALAHALCTDSLRSHSMLIESVMYIDGTMIKSSPTAEQEKKASQVVDENRARLDKEPKPEPWVAPEGPGDAESAWAHLSEEDRKKDLDYQRQLTEPPKQELKPAGAAYDKSGVPLPPAHKANHEPAHKPDHEKQAEHHAKPEHKTGEHTK